MDQRMMDAGGAQKRVELLKLVNVSNLASSMQSMTLNEKYSEEEKKVAMYGEKGQGEYLTGAKRGRK
jgi:hypothetical protein